MTQNRLTITDTLSYDAASNRLAEVSVFTPRIGPTPPSTVVRTLGYSDSGNTTQDDNGGGTVLDMAYDSSDRLVAVSQGAATIATYAHNALGQRVAKDTGGGATHFLYDLSGRLIAEADGATTAEYVWLEGMPLAFLQSGQAFFVHADHLGTPQKLTEGAAAIVWDATFRPFGEADSITGSLAFNLRFPGQYFDTETGLHYNYFRDYDPALGRYVQSDPIGLRGGWNTYAYVGGNPVRFVDPRGLAIPPEFGNFVSCVVVKTMLQIFCKRGEPKGCNKKKYPGLSCDEIAARYDRFMTCIQIRQSITNICYAGIPDAGHDEQQQNLANGAEACARRYATECLSCPGAI